MAEKTPDPGNFKLLFVEPVVKANLKMPKRNARMGGSVTDFKTAPMNEENYLMPNQYE